MATRRVLSNRELESWIKPFVLVLPRTLEMRFSATVHSSTRDATVDLSGNATATFTFGTSC
jgi:hypothetical protein